MRKNMVLGLPWDVVAHPAQLTLCLVPSGKRKINVTLPTGKVERFTAANKQDCAVAQIPEVDIQLTALPGTTSTMEIVNVPMLLTQGGQLYDLDNLEPWNPKEFKLTTEDNYVYYLTEGVGITQIKDPSGNTLTYGQNGIVHSNGQSVAFTRDASQRITAITDPAGNAIRYSYNAAGDLTSMTSRMNAVSKFSYNSSHGLVDYTDPNGTVTARYTYDTDGRLIAKYDADGKATLLTVAGASTLYEYDSKGNRIKETDPAGNVTNYTFDANGKEISRSWSRVAATGGNLTEHASSKRDADGRIIEETDAAGKITKTEYNAGGQITAMVDPSGGRTVLEYNARGRLAKTTYPDGSSESIAYDAENNKTSVTDSQGRSTRYEYDALNRLSKTLYPDGSSNSAEYDAAGRIAATVDANGNRTVNTYDVGGRLIGVKDGGGAALSLATTLTVTAPV